MTCQQTQDPGGATAGMVSRRRSLQFAGTALAVALAGCSSGVLGTDASRTEYELDVHRFDAALVPWALYEPDDDELFGQPARTALDAILPDGRYSALGYVPLWEGNYVEHDGRYYRTETVVTGRAERTRPVVRVDSVGEDAVPEDPVVIDSLDQPSARPIKILHSHAASGGASGTSDLLRGDAYVMTRPAERDSRLVTGDLDGRVVTMGENGGFPYRVEVRREQITLTEHTVLAVEVADSREAFREVVLGSRVDADLETADLPSNARDLLDRAIERGTYRETGEPSEAFETLLRRLDIDPDESAVGRIIWDGDSLFDAALYVGETG